MQSQQEASKKLEEFNDDRNNLIKLKYFVESSQNKYCQYLAASAMKKLLEDNWKHVSPDEKVAVRKYLVSYLLNAQVVLS